MAEQEGGPLAISVAAEEPNLGQVEHEREGGARHGPGYDVAADDD